LPATAPDRCATLDALAAAQPVLEASSGCTSTIGRGRLAAGWYEAGGGAWKPTGEIAIVTAESLVERIQKPTLVCGEMTFEERRILSRLEEECHPGLTCAKLSPSLLPGRAGLAALAGRRPGRSSYLAPFYLQQKDQIPDGEKLLKQLEIGY
jgi:hypothetical protein